MWTVQAGAWPAIVDNVDDLKTNCPQCPQIKGKAGENKGARARFVDNMDNVDNPF